MFDQLEGEGSIICSEADLAETIYDQELLDLCLGWVLAKRPEEVAKCLAWYGTGALLIEERECLFVFRVVAL